MPSSGDRLSLRGPHAQASDSCVFQRALDPEPHPSAQPSNRLWAGGLEYRDHDGALELMMDWTLGWWAVVGLCPIPSAGVGYAAKTPHKIPGSEAEH